VPPPEGTIDSSITPGPGQATPAVSEIIFPVITVTPNPDGTVVHVVQSGQSLWSIAIAYGTKIDSILSLNGLSSGGDNTIYIGQELLIAIVPTPTSSSTTLPTVTATVRVSTQHPETTHTKRPTELTPTVLPTTTVIPMTKEKASTEDMILPAMFIIFGLGLFLVIISLVTSKKDENQ
ncbi:MAG: LysM peptidoglycan-binding domain-containing protein, partial [Anaerolineaceae bacterium]|nr:LysM peptidoglycan-binding domain-containing protein [Anaerolineaceae bacterium]